MSSSSNTAHNVFVKLDKATGLWIAMNYQCLSLSSLVCLPENIFCVNVLVVVKTCEQVFSMYGFLNINHVSNTIFDPNINIIHSIKKRVWVAKPFWNLLKHLKDQIVKTIMMKSKNACVFLQAKHGFAPWTVDVTRTVRWGIQNTSCRYYSPPLLRRSEHQKCRTTNEWYFAYEIHYQKNLCVACSRSSTWEFSLI